MAARSFLAAPTAFSGTSAASLASSRSLPTSPSPTWWWSSVISADIPTSSSGANYQTKIWMFSYRLSPMRIFRIFPRSIAKLRQSPGKNWRSEQFSLLWILPPHRHLHLRRILSPLHHHPPSPAISLLRRLIGVNRRRRLWFAEFRWKNLNSTLFRTATTTILAIYKQILAYLSHRTSLNIHTTGVNLFCVNKFLLEISWSKHAIQYAFEYS